MGHVQGGATFDGVAVALRDSSEGCLSTCALHAQAGRFSSLFRELVAVVACRGGGHGAQQPILAVDSKILRRSHDRKNDLDALHSVSVWASDFGLTLAQVATAEKSNEFTAIPEVLKLVDLGGAIVMIAPPRHEAAGDF